MFLFVNIFLNVGISMLHLVGLISTEYTLTLLILDILHRSQLSIASIIVIALIYVSCILRTLVRYTSICVSTSQMVL